MQSEADPIDQTDNLVRRCRGCHRETHRARPVIVEFAGGERELVVCPDCEPDLRGDVVKEVTA